MTPRLHHALCLAALLAACSNTPGEPEPVPAPSAPSAASAPSASAPDEANKSPYANVEVPADARYLFDPESGAVLIDVPPPILADITAQLTASGQGAHIADLARLYDLESGHVRDEGKARAAESTMRAKLQGGAR